MKVNSGDDIPGDEKPGKVQRQPSRSDDRMARLAVELRANLMKRKAQARARASGTQEGDDPPPGQDGD